MPIYEAPGKDSVTSGQPVADAPKMVVCTISPSDAGAPCPHCGYAGGMGHGQARG